jgi:RHS repeat-associated protein
LIEAETDNCTGGRGTGLITDEWFSYSARGELTDVWEKTPTSNGYYHTSASYYANGVISSLALPTFGTVTYNVDGEGRAVTAVLGPSTNLVCDPACSTNSTTFDPAGRPLVINIGGLADNDTYTYDAAGRMKTYAFNVNSKAIGGTLNWNPNGTLQSLVTTDGFNAGGAQNCNFGTSSVAGYDDLARLLRADCGSVWSQTFSYDVYNNLTKTGNPGISWNPGYNPANNRFTLAGTSYDNDGHLLVDGLNNDYTWDAYGKITSAGAGGPAVCGTSGTCLTYDALGRMVEKNVAGAYTEILYSPIGKTAIMQGQTAQSAYIPLPGGATAYFTGGAKYFWHNDWLGTTRFASTIAGRALVFDRAFAPYGDMYNNFGQTANPSYTGNTQDTYVGLYDTPTRELAQNAGSWLSPDSVGLGNRYAYASNPLILTDPSGMEPDVITDVGQTTYIVNGMVMPTNLAESLLGMGAGGFNSFSSSSFFFNANAAMNAPSWSQQDGQLYAKFGFWQPNPNYDMDVQGSLLGTSTSVLVNLGSIFSSASGTGAANNGPSWWGAFAKNLFSWKNFTDEFKQGGCVNVFGSATAGALNPFSPSLSSAGEGTAAVLAASKYNAAVQYAASAPNYLGGTGLIYPMKSSVVRSMVADANATAASGG